jgi:hypothetical protein
MACLECEEFEHFEQYGRSTTLCCHNSAAFTVSRGTIEHANNGASTSLNIGFFI